MNVANTNSILQKSTIEFYNNKGTYDKLFIIVDNIGKGNRIYSSKWFQNGGIKTHVSLGEEVSYAKASVLVFLDYLIQNLQELFMQNIFYSIFDFQNTVALNGLSDIKNIINWPYEISSHVESNLDEHKETHQMLRKTQISLD